MNYIVLDLEWNQPVSKKHMIRTPIRLDGEIIQIGAVKLNEDLETIDTFEVMVAPVYYKKMNRCVREVTLLTEGDIAKGAPFESAICMFKEWCKRDDEECLLFTWGPDDIYVLEDNLMLHDISAAWIPKAYDAQLIFDDQVTMEDRRFSLSYAIWKFGIKPWPAHNALNDAKNTVEIMRRLNVAEWLNEEPFESDGCMITDNII